MSQIRIYPVLLLAALFLAQSLSLAKSTKNQESIIAPIPKATITFSTGSSTLTPGNRALLRHLIQDARAKGTIGQITVAAWSDINLPAVGETILDPNRILAQKRADAIENFLRSEEKIANVEKFNMAESSNWLARNFNSMDAELKSVFGMKAADLPMTSEEFRVIKDEGGPSKAVVIVERKMP